MLTWSLLYAICTLHKRTYLTFRTITWGRCCYCHVTDESGNWYCNWWQSWDSNPDKLAPKSKCYGDAYPKQWLYFWIVDLYVALLCGRNYIAGHYITNDERIRSVCENVFFFSIPWQGTYLAQWRVVWIYKIKIVVAPFMQFPPDQL